jgi:hypothetical protein
MYARISTTLLNNVVSNLENVAVNNFTIVNNEFDRLGKEAVVA